MPVVMGIETSCDETGVGIVADGELLGEALASSMDEHVRFGGVVPEVAARAHVLALVPMVHTAVVRAGIELSDLTHVAVTAGPGLATALHVGVAGAKAYASALGIPIYAVHHLAGHLAADTVDLGPLPDPSIALVVSGGHTSLLAVTDLVGAPIEHLGDTFDDAAGECFDKVARLLGLAYPGGPAVDAAAAGGNPAAYDFPRALRGREDAVYDFSFSGLKTAMARWRATNPDAPVDANLVASFQEAVVDVLAAKAVRACRDRGVGDLLVVGGVAANSRLRAVVTERCAAVGVRVRIPPPRRCTDNGTMIAALGDLLARSGAEPSPPAFGVTPTVPLHRAQLA